MSLGDCSVGMWGFYTDPVSPATLFDFFADNLANWRHPLDHKLEREHRSLSVWKHAQISQSTSNSPLTLAPGAPMHSCAFAHVQATHLG